jgi:hypothetical protein
MAIPAIPLHEVDPDAFHFYRDVLARLHQAGVPCLIGGAYALASYTGIVRHTKDIDLFTRPGDAPAVLKVLERAGYRTEMTFPHWLGKAFSGQDFVDVIFSSGNGLCPVDDACFANAPLAEVLGFPVRLAPAEEMIWQKAFLMERERFDGADVNHLLRARGAILDWQRLRRRFGPHWRVLLAHLTLFGFVYPAEQGLIPAWLLQELADRLKEDKPASEGPEVCWGPVLSREQYLTDISCWGYSDARLPPWGRMTPEQVAQWTAAIGH